LETGTYTLELTELGTLDITSVSVAPIYLAPSGDEVLGEVTDTNEPSDNDLEGGSDDPSPPGCTPDCVDKKCGDDGCGGSCGTCDVGFVCDGTQACVEEEECVDTCSSLGYECGTFDVCGVSTECGTCSGDFETCDAVAGVCESEQILAGGVIDSIWPGSAPIYFDSNSLPKDLVEIETYRTKYINFSSLPGFCHQIFLAEYAPDGGYDMSHLGFENVISHLTTHTPEDPILFDVWETPTFCGNQ